MGCDAEERRDANRKISANKNKNKFVSESCAVVVVEKVSYIQMRWNWDASQQPHFRLRLSFSFCYKLKIWACFGLLGTHMTLLSAVDISQRFTFPLDSQIASTARWEKSSAWAKLSYVRNEIRFSHSWIIFSAFYYSERIMKLAIAMCACCSYDVSAKLVRWCRPRTGHNRCIMLLANSIYRRVSKSVGQRAHRANRVWFSSVDVFLLSKSERANKKKAFWKSHRESCSFSRLSDKAAHVLHVVCVVFVRKFEMWGRKKFIYFLMFSVFLVTTTAKF